MNELELLYTELDNMQLQIIEIDEKSKEFKLYDVEEIVELDKYTFISQNTMNAVILGLKQLEFVLID